MTQSLEDARWRALELLQRELQRRSPGTFGHEIAEKALSLSLSDRRAAGHAPHLFRSTLRDARRILVRARDRRPEDVGTDVDAFTDDAQADPEEALRLKRMLEELRDEASAIHPAGVACLEGLLAGETVHETAGRARAPVHVVKELRSRIRGCARELWLDAA